MSTEVKWMVAFGIALIVMTFFAVAINYCSIVRIDGRVDVSDVRERTNTNGCVEFYYD